MPDYTIETTYHLPVFRHRTYSAETCDAACRAAIEDNDWDDARHDYETAGETHVTGIWQGADAAYRAPAITIRPEFKETVQRKAVHFEILLGVLKIILADIRSDRPTASDWVARASCAVARAEAILAGAPDPETLSGTIIGGESDG